MRQFPSVAGRGLRLLRIALFGRASERVRLLVRAMQLGRSRGMPRLARWASGRLESYGLFISAKASIGEGFRLPHPTAIIIGEGVTVGRRVTVYQSVTMGGRIKGDWRAGNYPTIGDDTVIFAGAVIVGNVRIGRNCVIGANAVVNRDIPDNATAVGAPARVVGFGPEIFKSAGSHV